MLGASVVADNLYSSGFRPHVALYVCSQLNANWLHVVSGPQVTLRRSQSPSAAYAQQAIAMRAKGGVQAIFGLHVYLTRQNVHCTSAALLNASTLGDTDSVSLRDG